MKGVWGQALWAKVKGRRLEVLHSVDSELATKVAGRHLQQHLWHKQNVLH